MRRGGPARQLVCAAAVVLAAGCTTPTALPTASDIGSANVTSGSHSDYRYRWGADDAGAESVVAVDSTPLRLLRGWDRRRAAAYAEGSVPALRRLYTPGSETGEADVRMLREYVARDLRVVGLQMQILRVEVLDHRPGEWRLRVTDRLHRAVAVSDNERVRLPRDQASTRELRLVRGEDGRWLIAEARPVTHARAQAGPGDGNRDGRM